MTHRTLKIDAFAGLSGDMFLGALCELTDAHALLQTLPERLSLPAEVVVTRAQKNTIACTQVTIRDLTPHDERPHRHLSDILEILSSASLTPGAQSIARDIFFRLAQAESAVHGVGLEAVHFHEVGAVDSIIDIAGVALMLDMLQPSACVSSAVRTGFGMVRTEHGLLPVPAPATHRLLEGVPTFPGDYRGECTTPTGAAILAFLKPSFETRVLTVLRTGRGGGQRDCHYPNLLRLSLCEESLPMADDGLEPMLVIETHVDDLTGEFLGADFQRTLLEEGAQDVFLTHVVMKKGRPGILVTVLVRPDHASRVRALLFEHTTTLGVRQHLVQRHILERQHVVRDTPLGQVQAKRAQTPHRARIKPEHDAVQKLARDAGISPLDASEIIRRALDPDVD